MSRETILSTISGTSESERLLLVLSTAPDHSRIELRQQSFGEGIGWFTQSTITLEPSQVAELRAALGTGTRGPSPLPKQFRQAKQAAWQPRLVHADSA